MVNMVNTVNIYGKQILHPLLADLRMFVASSFESKELMILDVCERIVPLTSLNFKGLLAPRTNKQK